MESVKVASAFARRWTPRVGKGLVPKTEGGTAAGALLALGSSRLYRAVEGSRTPVASPPACLRRTRQQMQRRTSAGSPGK